MLTRTSLFNKLRPRLDTFVKSINRVFCQIIGGLALIGVSMVSVYFTLSWEICRLFIHTHNKNMCYKTGKRVKKKNIHFLLIINMILYVYKDSLVFFLFIYFFFVVWYGRQVCYKWANQMDRRVACDVLIGRKKRSI